MRLNSSLALLVLCSVTAGGHVGAAAPDDAATPEAALKLGRMALEAFRGESWADALEKFTAADQAAHSPVFGLYRARCLKNLGRWTEARGQFDAVASEAVPETAPMPWQQAREDAKRDLSQLLEVFPTVEVRLRDGKDPTLEVAIDRGPVIAEARESGGITFRQPLDPGPHEVRVARGAKTVDARQFTVKPGREALVIELGPYEQLVGTTLESADFSRAGPSLRKADTLPNSASSPVAPRDHTVAYVGLGVGLLGATAGTVAGILAWRSRNALLDHCNSKTCSDQYETDLDRAKLYGNVATAAFIAGGAGFTLAGIMLVVAPGTATRPSSAGIELSGRF